MNLPQAPAWYVPRHSQTRNRSKSKCARTVSWLQLTQISHFISITEILHLQLLPTIFRYQEISVTISGSSLASVIHLPTDNPSLSHFQLAWPGPSNLIGPEASCGPHHSMGPQFLFTQLLNQNIPKPSYKIINHHIANHPFSFPFEHYINTSTNSNNTSHLIQTSLLHFLQHNWLHL